jgi:hypothetical protein
VRHTGDRVAPTFMNALPPRYGFERTEVLEVLAFELDDPRPRLPRLDVPTALLCAALVRDEAGIRKAHAVESRILLPNSPAFVEPEIHAYLRGIEGLIRHKPGPEGDAATRCWSRTGTPPRTTPRGSGWKRLSTNVNLYQTIIRCRVIL